VATTSTNTLTVQIPFSPQSFGKYFLIDKIATGGMAEIFKAKTFSHGGFENLLVIKRILPHIGENQEFVSMFVDEARVSVALQHPNIVRVFDFGKILENYFIAMECVDGKDVRNILRKLARKKEWLPPRYAAFVAHEVCKGLHYAHTKTDIHGNPYGIVHRDISPSNVLVSYEGEVKIADFGIAKAENNVYQTRDGMLKGKFEYMSPEQAQGREIDHRSDLFSLGIILWEMCVGRRLFKGESELATLRKIRDAEIPTPSSVRPDVPPQLEQIVMRALSREVELRYSSAQEMGDDLRKFLFPDDADKLRREVHAYLQGLFGEEMADERHRLESGNQIALLLRDRLSGDWETSASEVTMTRMTQTAVQFVVPWIAAIGLGMLAVFATALGLLLLFIVNQTTPLGGQPVSEQTVVQGPTGIDVVVVPKAKILLDGNLAGEGKTLTLEELAPGPHTLRFEAEGHEPVELPVQVEEGKLVRVVQELVPMTKTAPAPAQGTPAVTGPPKVDFRSVPSGATVLLDNTDIGRTPLTWTAGSPGRTYAVEMRLDGYQTAKGTLRDLKKGPQKYSLTLPEMKAPATLSVVLVGGGWANVFVDGKQLSKTAPFKDYSLGAGSHEIRVENPGLGLSQVETHRFVAGQNVTIRVKAP
jgi:serine/threonine protein kinase